MPNRTRRLQNLLVTDQLDRALAALDQAEARLAERARVRHGARERREHQRELRRRWLEGPGRIPALALAGTVVLVVMLAASGGDLSGWPYAAALAAEAAVFVAPAAIAGLLWRDAGAALAVAAALAVLGLQLTFTFVGAFLVLHLGPA